MTIKVESTAERQCDNEGCTEQIDISLGAGQEYFKLTQALSDGRADSGGQWRACSRSCLTDILEAHIYD